MRQLEMRSDMLGPSRGERCQTNTRSFGTGHAISRRTHDALTAIALPVPRAIIAALMRKTMPSRLLAISFGALFLARPAASATCGGDFNSFLAAMGRDAPRRASRGK
jgi:hypothetical protein